MSLLDLASLVLAPTATKEGKVYSAIPDTGEGDMTFSRGSSATRINSEGLIEKERANLLLQSNSFDTTWYNSSSTETGGQAGYDGTNNAWLFTKTGANGGIRQNNTTSGVQTFSFYAKANESTWVKVNNLGSSAYSQANFDLVNGLVGTTAYIVDAKIEDVGSGWYRCITTYNTTLVHIDIRVADSDNVVSGTSGSIYIQDAQLEQGLVATDYIPTTTTAVYEGITDDVPRVDYSGGGCPSLLLEPSRTQLLPHSEYFGAWNNARTIDTDNQAISPEGLVNAAYLEQQSGQTSAGSIYFGLTFGSTADYTTSIFAKKAEKNFIVAYDKNTDRTYFNLDTGTVGTTPAGVTASIEDFGNGWYRCSATFNTAAGGGNIAWYLGDTDNSTTVTDSGGVYIYGAMVEAGSYVSSYINSYGTSTTRVADSCSKTGISELIGQTEGTFYVETKSIANDSSFKQIAFDDGTTNNLITIDYTSTDNQLRSFIRDGGTAYSMTATISDSTTFNKIAIKAKDNDFAMWVNGTEVATSVTATYPSDLDNIEFDNGAGGGLFYGNVKQMILFPTALTDTQLEELTK